jgi:monoamine oxidase
VNSSVVGDVDRMAAEVPLDAPWDAPKAREWDSQTVATWIDQTFPDPTHTLQTLLGMGATLTFSAGAAETSLLGLLFQIHSCRGVESLMSIKGGMQQDRVVGGAQAIANRVANRLGDAIHLQTPVRRVAQDAGGVTVSADGLSVRARRAIVTVPPPLADSIAYDPPLPPQRVFLTSRMPAGWSIKAVAVYDDPFWRSDGLSGQAISLGAPVSFCVDGSPESGRPGALLAFSSGAAAQKLAALSDEERKRTFLGALTKWFGARAAAPIFYTDHDWAKEEWTRGCATTHYPPGVLTAYGSALRVPTGRVHWAGSETSPEFVGAIDGAVRSGERVAREVVQAG